MNDQFFERAIGLGALALILILFFRILQPFIGPLLWGIILSVTSWPLFARLRRVFGGHGGLAAFVMVLLLLVILVVPLGMLTRSLGDQVQAVNKLAHDLITAGLPPPPAWVGHLPMIGSQLEAEWQAAMLDSRSLLQQAEPYLAVAARWIIARGADLGFAALQFLLAIIIAGILFTQGETSADYMRRFARRVGSEQTVALVDIAGRTIRSVALGVVGTALVQALLATLVFWIAAVPGAGLLGLLVFLVSLLQLPVLIVPLPVAIWVGYQGLTGWAIFVAVGGLFVGTIDNFIRPYLIRQGANLPLVLIFLGVLGGILAYGPIGMFFGAMVVAVVHRLLTEWLSKDSEGVTGGGG